MGFLKKIFSSGENQKLLNDIEQLINDKNFELAKESVDILLQKDNLNKNANYLGGIVSFNTSDFVKAEDYFKFSIDEFPKSGYYLGIINFNNKEYKKAISYFEKFALNNSDLNTLEYLGKCYLLITEFEKVFNITDKIKELRGDSVAAYLLAAETYLFQDNPKRAVIEINKLIEFDKEVDQAYLLRGKARTIIKDFDKAITDLTLAVKLNNQNPEAYFYLGICYSTKKDFENALRNLDLALESSPYKPALELRSEIYLTIDNPDAALEDINLLIEQNPKSTKYLLKSADLKIKLFDQKGAKEDLEKALKFENENLSALYKLSKLEFNNKNYRAVNKYLTRAISIKLDSDIVQLRGRAHYHLKDFQSAMKDLSKSIDLNSENYSAYYYRAKVKEALKDNYGAITDYTKSLGDQNFTDAYYSRGKLRLELKEYNAASKDFSKAIKLKPSEAVYYYLRGQCNNYMEKPIEAIEDLDKAISLKNNFVQAILLRGMISYANRAFSKSKSDFEKVIELDKRYENHVNVYLEKLKQKII